jgi:hypothetical protein
MSNKKEFIRKLRETLRTEGKLSPAAIEALEKLVKAVTSIEASNENWEGLVDFLASQVLQGVDIHEAYPEAYQLLVDKPETYIPFADLLEAITVSKSNTPTTYPEIKQLDLEILGKKATDESTIRSNLWEGMFRRSAEELSGLFTKPAHALRGDHNSQEKWVSVLREDIHTAEDRSIALNLEISAATPEELNLSLSIASHSTKQDEPNLAYKVHVSWGHYACGLKTTDTYRQELPPVRIAELMAGSSIVQDLEIALEAT